MVVDVALLPASNVEQFRSSSATQFPVSSAELSACSSVPLYPGSSAGVFLASNAAMFPGRAAHLFQGSNVGNSANLLLGVKSVAEMLFLMEEACLKLSNYIGTLYKGFL